MCKQMWHEGRIMSRSPAQLINNSGKRIRMAVLESAGRVNYYDIHKLLAIKGSVVWRSDYAPIAKGLTVPGEV